VRGCKKIGAQGLRGAGLLACSVDLLVDVRSPNRSVSLVLNELRTFRSPQDAGREAGAAGQEARATSDPPLFYGMFVQLWRFDHTASSRMRL
jgi:hypothetical protein